jgi:hypothetical protein
MPDAEYGFARWLGKKLPTDLVVEMKGSGKRNCGCDCRCYAILLHPSRVLRLICAIESWRLFVLKPYCQQAIKLNGKLKTITKNSAYCVFVRNFD